jgi:hypothetical protein
MRQSGRYSSHLKDGRQNAAPTEGIIHHGQTHGRRYYVMPPLQRYKGIVRGAAGAAFCRSKFRFAYACSGTFHILASHPVIPGQARNNKIWRRNNKLR